MESISDDLPGELERLTQLGDADPAAGAEACKAALSAHPDSMALWGLYGRLLSATGRFVEAEAALARTLELAPGDPGARRRLAMLKLERGRPSEAIAVMQAAPARPKLARELEPAWIRLLIEIGDFDAAIARVDVALATAPSPDLATLRQIAQSGAQADQAEGLSSEAKRRYLEGLERLVDGDPAAAVAELEAAVGLSPAYAPAWAALKGARALLSPGDAEPVGAPEAARPLLARRAGGRGLVFDPRDRFPIRRRADVLTEVSSPSELTSNPNSWLTLDAGGERAEAGPSIRLGDSGDDFRAGFQTGETFIAALADAAVVGRGQVINAGGALIEELSSHVSPYKFGARRREDTLSFDPRAFRDGLCPIKVFEEPAMLMTGPTDAAFGDWVVNFLPRVSIARRVGLDVNLVVRTKAKAFVRQTLAAVGVDPSRLIEHDAASVSVFRRLYAPGWPMPDRRTAILGHLGGLTAKAAVSGGEGPQRLYLSREAMAPRPLVNEAEVRARFEARGFVTVRPEELSLETLCSLLSGASHVAGGYGSAWLNLAFCERKPACMVLAPDYYEGFLREVSMWLGGMAAPFGLLLGSHDGDLDAGDLLYATWRLELDRLEAAIDRFLAWRAPT